MEPRRPENHRQYEAQDATEHEQDSSIAKFRPHPEAVREEQGGNQPRNRIAEYQSGDNARQANFPSLGGLGRLLARRDVSVSFLLTAIGQYTLMASVWGFIPILAKRMGAGNVQISLLVTVHIVFIILGSLIASRHARLVKGRGMLTISFVLMAAGIGLAAIAPSLVWIFAAQVIHGLSIGLSYPVLMGLAIENVPPEERSTAMGLHQSIYAIGLFAGPWVSGILADFLGIQPMFAITALACLILGVLGVRWLFLDRPLVKRTA